MILALHFEEAGPILCTPCREGGGTKRKKRAAGTPVWQECEDALPATGQRFRFFWNVETGKSSYVVPPTYIPLQDPRSSLTPPPPPSAAAAPPGTAVVPRGPTATPGASPAPALPTVKATMPGAGSQAQPVAVGIPVSSPSLASHVPRS